MLNYDYISNNKAESIVLLHGYGGNSNCFKKQIDQLKNLFNIVLVDMHGHGKSRDIHLVPTEKFNLKKIASDINHLLEKLHIAKAHFMGLSLGTIVANAYAYHYPQKVLSLLNIGAIIKLKSFDHKIMQMVYSLRNFLPHMLVYYVAGFVIMPKRQHQKAREIFINEAKKMNSTDFFTWAKLMMSFETLYPSEKLNKDIPSLYVSGASDHVFLKEVKKHCEHCMHSELYVLANTGHICNIDDPQGFNRVMTGYYLSL